MIIITRQRKHRSSECSVTVEYKAEGVAQQRVEQYRQLRTIICSFYLDNVIYPVQPYAKGITGRVALPRVGPLGSNGES